MKTHYLTNYHLSFAVARIPDILHKIGETIMLACLAVSKHLLRVRVFTKIRPRGKRYLEWF